MLALSIECAINDSHQFDALTSLGNNNHTNAIGRQNLASTTGTPGTGILPATGNNNVNNAIGKIRQRDVVPHEQPDEQRNRPQPAQVIARIAFISRRFLSAEGCLAAPGSRITHRTRPFVLYWRYYVISGGGSAV